MQKRTGVMSSSESPFVRRGISTCALLPVLLLCLSGLQMRLAVRFCLSADVGRADPESRRGENVKESFCIPLVFLYGSGILSATVGTIGDHYCLAVGVMAAGGLIGLLSYNFTAGSEHK